MDLYCENKRVKYIALRKGNTVLFDYCADGVTILPNKENHSRERNKPLDGLLSNARISLENKKFANNGDQIKNFQLKNVKEKQIISSNVKVIKARQKNQETWMPQQRNIKIIPIQLESTFAAENEAFTHRAGLGLISIRTSRKATTVSPMGADSTRKRKELLAELSKEQQFSCNSEYSFKETVNVIEIKTELNTCEDNTIKIPMSDTLDHNKESIRDRDYDLFDSGLVTKYSHNNTRYNHTTITKEIQPAKVCLAPTSYLNNELPSSLIGISSMRPKTRNTYLRRNTIQPSMKSKISPFIMVTGNSRSASPIEARPTKTPEKPEELLTTTPKSPIENSSVKRRRKVEISITSKTDGENPDNILSLVLSKTRMRKDTQNHLPNTSTSPYMNRRNAESSKNIRDCSLPNITPRENKRPKLKRIDVKGRNSSSIKPIEALFPESSDFDDSYCLKQKTLEKSASDIKKKMEKATHRVLFNFKTNIKYLSKNLLERKLNKSKDATTPLPKRLVQSSLSMLDTDNSPVLKSKLENLSSIQLPGLDLSSDGQTPEHYHSSAKFPKKLVNFNYFKKETLGTPTMGKNRELNILDTSFTDQKTNTNVQSSSIKKRDSMESFSLMLDNDLLKSYLQEQKIDFSNLDVKEEEVLDEYNFVKTKRKDNQPQALASNGSLASFIEESAAVEVQDKFLKTINCSDTSNSPLGNSSLENTKELTFRMKNQIEEKQNTTTIGVVIMGTDRRFRLHSQEDSEPHHKTLNPKTDTASTIKTPILTHKLSLKKMSRNRINLYEIYKTYSPDLNKSRLLNCSDTKNSDTVQIAKKSVFHKNI